MAIVYSYPKVTSPLATDVLVLTDTTVTAGKRKNKTKSIAMSDVATYIINSKSGITGSGTVNKFPIFTAATVVGDSIITQAAGGAGITVAGNLDVTDDTNLQGSLLADSLEVANDSVFTGSARFNGTIKDTSGGVGTNGQVLTSTGTGVAWATDAGGSVTGTGTTNYIAKWNTSSSIQDSIIFDNGTNVGVGTATPSAKLHVNGSEFLVTQGNETGLNINNDTYIYKIGDISGGENQAYMQIDSAASKAFFLNSNVGIGTTSPSAKLHVNSSDSITVQKIQGATSAALEFFNSTTKTGAILLNSSQFLLAADASNPLTINTGGSERMRVLANGNVGIGVTNPHTKLTIEDSNIAGTSQFGIGDVSSYYLAMGHNSSGTTDGFIGTVYDNNAARFDIRMKGTAQSDAKVTVLGSGNVGIGTTFPTEKLDIYSDGNAVVRLESAGGGVGMLDVGTDFTINNRINTNLIFKTSNTEKMRITNSGDVGIGTTSPYGKLNVIPSSNPTTPTTANQIAIGESSANSWYNLRLGYFFEGGAYRGSIQSIAGNTPNTLVLNGDGGNVGIGTISPVAKLHVKVNDSGATPIAQQHLILENNSATGIGILTPSATSGYLFFGDNNDAQRGFISYSHSSDSMAFKVSGSERMRIDSSGNVGIGTTSPSAKLTVSENAAGLVSSITNSNVGGSGVQITAGNGTNNSLQIRNYAGGELMRVQGNGNVGIGTTSPDSPLHIVGATNVPLLTLESTGDTILQINRNDDTIGGGNRTGIIQFGAEGSWGTNLATSKIWSYAEETFTSTANGTSLRFFTTELGAANPDEKMIIDTNGNVGIGTSSPGSKLEIKSNSISSASSGIRLIAHGSSDLIAAIGEKSNGKGRFHLYDNSTAKVSIYADGTDNYIAAGKVGIGTTSPASKLAVDGGDIEVDDSASGLILRSPNGTRYRIQVDNSGNLTTTAV